MYANMHITSPQFLRRLMWHATPKLSMQHVLFAALYQRPTERHVGSVECEVEKAGEAQNNA